MPEKKAVRIHDVELSAGVLVGERYQLKGHLGAGGFAQVFKGFDEVIQRPVAIKFLNVHTGNLSEEQVQNVLQRFEREARLAARIRHPNVVNIFDFGTIGENDDVPFIVMELLNGHDLEKELKGGAMEPVRAVDLFVECLEALGEAHEHEIIHKDIKPSNLFLSDPGQRRESLRIVDFGIAHIRSTTEGRLTATGNFLGTPQYMPPEYLSEQIVTPAFDVYQMGLVLVEMLTGYPVINEMNPMRAMYLNSTGEIEVSRAILESNLGPIVEKALAFDHQERFENAEEFAEALADVPDPDIDTSVGFADTMTLDNIGEAPTSAPLFGQRATPQSLTASPTGDQFEAEPGAFSPPPDESAELEASEEEASTDDGEAAPRRVPRGRRNLLAQPDRSFEGAELDSSAFASGGEAPSRGPEPERRRVALAHGPTQRAERGTLLRFWPWFVTALVIAAAAIGLSSVLGGDRPQEDGTATTAPETAVEVTIESRPPGAVVRRDDELLGITPVTIHFDTMDDPARYLEIKKQGYYAEYPSVLPTDAPSVTFDLEAVTRRQRPSHPGIRPPSARRGSGDEEERDESKNGRASTAPDDGESKRASAARKARRKKPVRKKPVRKKRNRKGGDESDQENSSQKGNLIAP